MIISRTPFRISFFGGGTDYPVWYRENGGAVLGTTINKYCYISARYLPPFFDHRHRIVYSKVENVKDISEIEHPAVRAVLGYLGINHGVEIHHDGDLPARSGLGSSSAFTVGLLHALYSLKGVMCTKERLAAEAIHVERDLLKENVGSQDQVLTAYGGFRRVSFNGDSSVHVAPVVLTGARVSELERHLMLFFTGFSRTASEIAGAQIQNTRNKKHQLWIMKQMVDEAIAILTNPTREITEFGMLLHEAWKLKRGLTDKISTAKIDEIYEAGLEAGALGGKLLGAGGGGFMILFARPQDQPKIRERLKDLLFVPFKFEDLGSQIIFYQPNGCE